jgi:hypothetical protein
MLLKADITSFKFLPELVNTSSTWFLSPFYDIRQ